MNNTITSLQESVLNIKRLKAQRYLYSRAKWLFGWQVFFNVAVVIIVALVALAYDKSFWSLPHKDLAWVVGACGMTFFLADTFLWTPGINCYRQLAAGIQQSFDSEVLQLSWDKILFGNQPSHEDVERYSRHYDKANHPANDLLGWYHQDISSVPLEVARFICQQTNCWWDMDLRRRYNGIIIGVGIALCGIMSIIAFYFGLTAQLFFALVVAPCLPFFATAASLFQNNRDAVTRLGDMKMEMESQWSAVLNRQLSLDQLTDFSRHIQRGIYLNRINNPLIFDWLYRLSKDDHEQTTSHSVSHYVQQYHQRP